YRTTHHRRPRRPHRSTPRGRQDRSVRGTDPIPPDRDHEVGDQRKATPNPGQAHRSGSCRTRPAVAITATVTTASQLGIPCDTNTCLLQANAAADPYPGQGVASTSTCRPWTAATTCSAFESQQAAPA